jgi:hypothetical protein
MITQGIIKAARYEGKTVTFIEGDKGRRDYLVLLPDVNEVLGLGGIALKFAHAAVAELPDGIRSMKLMTDEGEQEFELLTLPGLVAYCEGSGRRPQSTLLVVWCFSRINRIEVARIVDRANQVNHFSVEAQNAVMDTVYNYLADPVTLEGVVFNTVPTVAFEMGIGEKRLHVLNKKYRLTSDGGNIWGIWIKHDYGYGYLHPVWYYSPEGMAKIQELYERDEADRERIKAKKAATRAATMARGRKRQLKPGKEGGRKVFLADYKREPKIGDGL